MSRWSEQEEAPVASTWTPGSHVRPSKPKPPDFWSETVKDHWTKDGWSIVAVEVSSCLPKPGKSPVLYRVFPPGLTKHTGSFTILARAKFWAERQAKQQHGGKTV